MPLPSPQAAGHSARLVARIGERIDAAGGWLRFDEYMQLALYAPGLGYYAAGATKFGVEGDFVTAPEISPLFGRALAHQVAEILDRTGGGILEFGAGTGRLAESLLGELRDRGGPVPQYAIVETSAELRERQRLRLTDFPVAWLDAPPAAFDGVVLANEVLDVMPVRLFVRTAGGVEERGVQRAAEGFAFAGRPADAALQAAVAAVESSCGILPSGYGSEIGLQAEAWTRSLGGWLRRGVALLIDYGFPRREYYHPQRLMGTLMCHYRHHAHADPLWLPGLNDITAHVDFTAIADAALDAGLEVLGYTSQAHFLLNCGLVDLLRDAHSPQVAAAAHRLLSEAEMGELLKVMAVGRDPGPLRGFVRGDRRDRLG